jgi:hypothetical protein
MKARWREETTLDALDDLVAHLARCARNGRPILTVSDGWQLFTPSRTLGEADDERSSRSDRPAPVGRSRLGARLPGHAGDARRV